VRRGHLLRLAASTLGIAAFAAACGVGPSPSIAASDFAVPLVWHVESEDGRVVDSREADRPVNPASVVKLATSLRALATLGADHRFVSKFGVSGKGSGAREDRPVSLVVEGGADPDFHFENAVLVARALEQSGVSRVSGDLHVGSTFWMGWERGTVGRESDPVKRCLDMGRRLVAAWSPSTWSPEQRKAWSELAARRGWEASKPPSIAIAGRVRADPPPSWTTLVEHRSQPLLVILRRFNVFSNNDIERLDATVGSPATMPAFLEKRLGDAGAGTRFATSSGLNANRMSPRQVVALLRDLRKWLDEHGHRPADLMPVLGCGESTLKELFPRLRQSREADGLAGKTGTLNMQDGGVSALAGFLPAGPGLLFFVAAPGAGDRLPKARAAEEEWVRHQLAKSGPVGPLSCPAPVPTSEAGAEVVLTARRLSKR
jgi:D-alanyl-D-alanine carboxypeptidase/D-alanyl-D-alanine-endopeptidase (penicillin-binding protein 4)